MDFPQVGVATNVTISKINFDNYVWLEKTDGIRVVIGILQDETMLELQSINDMRSDMKFVLDCEKYLDKYFIFDVLVSNDMNVMDKHYLERIDSVRDIKYEKFSVKLSLYQLKDTFNYIVTYEAFFRSLDGKPMEEYVEARNLKDSIKEEIENFFGSVDCEYKQVNIKTLL